MPLVYFFKFNHFIIAWAKIREKFFLCFFFVKLKAKLSIWNFLTLIYSCFYRIRAKTSQDSCGLTISRSEAIDGGTWKCSMFSGSDLAGAVRYVTMNNAIFKLSKGQLISKAGFESSICYNHNKCRLQYYIGLHSNW